MVSDANGVLKYILLKEKRCFLIQNLHKNIPIKILPTGYKSAFSDVIVWCQLCNVS